MFAIGHFAVGYSIVMATLLITKLYKRIYRDIGVGILGGIWAMIPDGWWFFTGEVAKRWHEFHSSPWANIFFFHYWIDQHTDDYDMVNYAIVFTIAIIITTILLYLDRNKVICKEDKYGIMVCKRL